MIKNVTASLDTIYDILVVTGPTASGKTALAAAIARWILFTIY